jgi:hypothetical protein
MYGTKLYIPESKGFYRYLMKVKKTSNTSPMQAKHFKVHRSAPYPREVLIMIQTLFLCCGSGIIEFINPAFQVDADPDPDARFGYQKMKTSAGIFFYFGSTIAIYLSLVFLKRCPSYRRSLQPSKENILHFKK